MTVTGPAELLATWEAGLGRRAPDRARLLHTVARPGAGDGVLASLTAGEREADLFALRKALFGELMQVRLECAACGEAMEFDLDAGRFAERPTSREAARTLRVEQDGWEVEFRPPTVGDLAAAARSGADARSALLRRCVVAVLHGGRAADVDGLPGSVQRALARAAQEADPAADVTLNINCPECGEATRAELDIASYLWTELDAWAHDVLLDVHLLASAYGWSEPEILALSPLRRRYYLELCADA